MFDILCRSAVLSFVLKTKMALGEGIYFHHVESVVCLRCQQVCIGSNGLDLCASYLLFSTVVVFICHGLGNEKLTYQTDFSSMGKVERGQVPARQTEDLPGDRVMADRVPLLQECRSSPGVGWVHCCSKCRGPGHSRGSLGTGRGEEEPQSPSKRTSLRGISQHWMLRIFFKHL